MLSRHYFSSFPLYNFCRLPGLPSKIRQLSVKQSLHFEIIELVRNSKPKYNTEIFFEILKENDNIPWVERAKFQLSKKFSDKFYDAGSFAIFPNKFLSEDQNEMPCCIHIPCLRCSGVNFSTFDGKIKEKQTRIFILQTSKPYNLLFFLEGCFT